MYNKYFTYRARQKAIDSVVLCIKRRQTALLSLPPRVQKEVQLQHVFHVQVQPIAIAAIATTTTTTVRGDIVDIDQQRGVVGQWGRGFPTEIKC